MKLKGRFDDVDTIKMEATRELNSTCRLPVMFPRSGRNVGTTAYHQQGTT
jgi:hypothetical protein